MSPALFESACQAAPRTLLEGFGRNFGRMRPLTPPPIRDYRGGRPLIAQSEAQFDTACYCGRKIPIEK